LPSQPASDVTPDTPTPILTADAAGAAPVSSSLIDDGAPPLSDHFNFHNPHSTNADPQFASVQGADAPPLTVDYMAPLATDQFQFSDPNTGHSALNNGHNVIHAAEVDPQATVQALIDATTAADHPVSSSTNDASMLPGMDVTASHGHQAAIHAHAGTV